VLLSNLGVTVLVRHLVDLVKQVTIVCPQGRKEFSIVFSIFVPYHSKKKKNSKKMPSDAPSLFIENVYVSQDI
jgi:hypothetical protein